MLDRRDLETAWSSVVQAGRAMGAMTERVDVGEVQVAFRRAGRGPSLLLLHGAVCDSRVWRLAIEEFADEFTVVAWDAPGCGGSSDAPEGYRMPDYADCLAGFMERLGLGRCRVVGHSWGSALALELCRRHPARVASLVLVGAYAGWAGSLPAEDVNQRLAFALQTAEAVDSRTWRPTSMPGLFSDAMAPATAQELAVVMGDIRASATRTMAHALAECDLRDALHDIDTPTLIVCGDRDERSPLAVAHALDARLPQSRLGVLHGLGHECYLEDPAAFHALVREFLHAV